MEKKCWHKITAMLLLGVFVLAIVPAESFHEHEQHAAVCTQSDEHIETIAFKCELANFVLPVLRLSQNHILKPLSRYFLNLKFPVQLFQHFFYPSFNSSRAPPVY